MTFTWDDTLATDLAKVRLRIGDTDEDDPLFTDETIEAMLVSFPDVDLCSRQLVQAAIAKLARENVDRNVASMSISRSQKINHLETVLAHLNSAVSLATRPRMTGTSKATVLATQQTADRNATGLEIDPYSRKPVAGYTSPEDDC